MPAPTPTCVCNWSRTGIWKSSVGLNDTETRLRKLVGVSAAFGCASLVPRPAEVLTPRHNFERPLPKGVWWDRYILVGAPSAGAGWENVWEAVPPGVRVAEVSAWAEDRLPAREWLAAWAASTAALPAGAVHVLQLSFPSRDGTFYTSKEHPHDSINQQLDELLAAVGARCDAAGCRFPVLKVCTPRCASHTSTCMQRRTPLTRVLCAHACPRSRRPRSWCR